MSVTGTPTNRTSVNLPVDVSSEILQKTQESSAIMQLARKIALPGRGIAINVITGDPEAEWVGETSSKPVKNPGLDTKVMRAYKLAVIVPFSNEFERDLPSLYQALVQRLPGALAQKFDATVFGAGDKPGSDFDNFASCTAQLISSDAYGGLVAADTDIATHGGILNGFAISPQAKGILLASKDKNDRPLFINGIQYHQLYHFNRHFALGGSLDIQTDRSLNLYNPTFDEAGKLISYEHPSLLEQTECGISLRCEITSPLFSVGAGLGCNILGKGYDFSRIYTQYSLKHFVNSRMFIFVSYRFNSTQYTHNMMYGLGLRF